jgi:ribonuclease E
MTKRRMLIDAANQEEMRVVVADDERVREFEVETAGKEQIKGNIYVAEVVRVEPSLQAAFVNYGGNRNGFLAFSEIHPQWFDLPKKEKTALIKEMEDIAAKQRVQHTNEDEDASEESNDKKAGAEAKDSDEAVEAKKEEKPKKRGRPSKKAKEKETDLTAEEEAEDAKALAIANAMVFDDDSALDVVPDTKDTKKGKNGVRRLRRASRGKKTEEDNAKKAKNTDSNENDGKKSTERFIPVHRRFNIGEVVKEKQKIIIQVTKEERGTKGAALTTYISMPGRFTVLMPNTPYAGGISRKINDHQDRKELRKIYNDISVPNAMGWIIRTAGVGQDKKGIEKDVKNMVKQWKKIYKDATADDAVMPNLVHEDGSLIIRAMRDMFTEDVEEVIISNKGVYRSAKEYVKSLMPERAKDVKEYKSQTPIFSNYGVESGLNHLHSTRVELESGGYLIINPTEALVSIDVNSGRATQEKNIEETAFKTNQEAAEEVARQLRLRDLAGLVVIDFIDMEDRRNERAIERQMRKAVHKDRARIQVGSISEFGLLEMSRQRLRPSFNESTTIRCPHCYGAGTVPSVQTAALMVLRNLEKENISAKADRVIITVGTDLAIYMLNHKKEYIRELESHYKFKIVIAADDKYIGPDHHLEMIRVQANGSERSQSKAVAMREKPETMDNRSRRKKRKNTRNERQKAKAANKGRGSKRYDKSKSEENEKKESKGEDKTKSRAKKTTRTRAAKKTAKDDTEKDVAKAKKETSKKEPATKKTEEKADKKPTAKKAKAKPVKPALTVQTVSGDGDTKVEDISKKGGSSEEKTTWWNRTFS